MRRAARVLGLTAVAALAPVLSGCDTRYDQHDFALVAWDAPWGSIFVNLVATGGWEEQGVKVSGKPYVLVFAPRLKAAPAPDCQLTVTGLSLTPLPGGPPVLSDRTVVLSAEPPDPREPNQRQHSAHFTYVPVGQAYMAQAQLSSLDLVYTRHRIAFDLRGGPTCPEAVRAPIHVDAVFDQRRMTGTATFWDVIGDV